MIDQQLIDSNRIRVGKALDTRTNTKAPNLYVISDALDTVVIEKLREYISSVPGDIWQTVENQESRSRSKITWASDTVIEELHEIFSAVTPEINQIFPGRPKNFWGISIWQDLPGYEIGWHIDNVDIDVALQLYLYSQPGMGTVFVSEHDPVLISSYHNSGYLVLHDNEHRIPHRTETIVPRDTVRYSLYAVWSRFPKHVADA